MNKYEEKIIEITDLDSSIHELLRKKNRSPMFQLFDLLVDNVFFFTDGLKSNGAYFLTVNNTDAKLIHIDKKSLNIKETNVTNIIKNNAKQKSFDYNGFKYTIIKKIR